MRSSNEAGKFIGTWKSWFYDSELALDITRSQLWSALYDKEVIRSKSYFFFHIWRLSVGGWQSAKAYCTPHAVKIDKSRRRSAGRLPLLSHEQSDSFRSERLKSCQSRSRANIFHSLEGSEVLLVQTTISWWGIESTQRPSGHLHVRRQALTTTAATTRYHYHYQYDCHYYSNNWLPAEIERKCDFPDIHFGFIKVKSTVGPINMSP